MQRKLISPKPATEPATRLAWWAAFLTTLLLILGLSVVRSASAEALPPLGPLNPSGAVETEEEGEEEEIEVEECEAGEEGEEEGEEEECGEAEFSAPPVCMLSSADAAVSADLKHDKLRLALRYEADTAATVAVEYYLRGSRGPLTFAGTQKHFGRGGVLHLTQDLSESQAKKVEAAKTFTVDVRPLNAPHLCDQYLDQHLSVRHAAPDGPMWTDEESTFPLPRRG